MCCQGPKLKEVLYISQFFRAIMKLQEENRWITLRVCLELQLWQTRWGQLLAARDRVQVNVDPSRGRERCRELGTFALSEKDSPNQTTKADLWFKLQRWLIRFDWFGAWRRVRWGGGLLAELCETLALRETERDNCYRYLTSGPTCLLSLRRCLHRRM